MFCWNQYLCCKKVDRLNLSRMPDDLESWLRSWENLLPLSQEKKNRKCGRHQAHSENCAEEEDSAAESIGQWSKGGLEQHMTGYTGTVRLTAPVTLSFRLNGYWSIRASYRASMSKKKKKKQSANGIGHRGAESNWTGFSGREAKLWWKLSQRVTLHAGSAGHRRANGLWERREQDGGQPRASTPSRLTLTLAHKKCICLSEGGWKPGLRAWTDYL